LIRDPSQNVSLLPGDVVFVSRDQKVFLVLGSTPSPGSIGGTNNRRFAFDNDNETLAEAVAKAGGLDSSRAEARSIFVFRHESRNTLASVGVDTAAYVDDLIPTIYRANWSKADGFFLANSFYIRHKDVIYVAEHPTADFNKFTASLRGVTGGAGDLARVLGGN
jgi:polysaccharide export outer membrane protein